MIYVASPYTSRHPETREFRYNLVRAFVTDRIALERQAVFSPIVYAHEIAKEYTLNVDAASWREFNMDILRHCSAVYVLAIDGWVSSVGVSEEIQIAKDLSIPVRYFDNRGIEILEMGER